MSTRKLIGNKLIIMTEGKVYVDKLIPRPNMLKMERDRLRLHLEAGSAYPSGTKFRKWHFALAANANRRSQQWLPKT